MPRIRTPENDRLRQDAIRIHRELGWSERQIADHLGTAKTNVHRALISDQGTPRYADQLAPVVHNGIAKVVHTPGPLALNTVHIVDAIQGMNLLPHGSVDLFFTDPPYNTGVTYGDATDRMPPDVYFRWCDDWFQAAHRVLRPGGSFYAMHYPEICVRRFNSLCRKFTYRRWITWHFPTNIGHSNRNWTRSHRTIPYFTKGDNYYFDGLADPHPYRNTHDRRIQALQSNGKSGVTPYDVWEYNLVKNVSKDKTEWPNQIPVSLVERIIKCSSRPGDLILDPFIGSGTTAVAAIQTNRRWIGFDINSDSFTKTRARIGSK